MFSENSNTNRCALQAAEGETETKEGGVLSGTAAVLMEKSS
jgi:hypothetical protein